MQAKVENLNINGKKTGLKINLRKTVVMKWNVNPGIKIQLERSVRLGKAQPVFCNLKNIWRNSQLSINTKLRIFRSSVLAVLLYGCKTVLILLTSA